MFVMGASDRSYVAGSGNAGFESELSQTSFPLSALPRSTSMDVNNDPRFFSNNVIAKRLSAFQTIVVVAVLMVNLSVKQMFTLEKNIDLSTVNGALQYTGFCLMTLVFLSNLTTVIVLIQQLFMTYRLLTVGPTGFEIAKSYYLNPNIVAMRHIAVKVFFFSLPLFVASSACMVYTSFASQNAAHLAMPIVVALFLASVLLWYVNATHSTIFKERYNLAKSHEQPLIQNLETMTQRSYGGWFSNIDV